MENLTVPELKKQCKSLNIKLTKTDGKPKLKKDLIKSLNQPPIIGGKKRRSRKRSSRKTSRKRSSKRRSRKVSKRRSRKRSSKRRSRKVSRRKSKKKGSKKMNSPKSKMKGGSIKTRNNKQCKNQKGGAGWFVAGGIVGGGFLWRYVMAVKRDNEKRLKRMKAKHLEYEMARLEEQKVQTLSDSLITIDGTNTNFEHLTSIREMLDVVSKDTPYVFLKKLATTYTSENDSEFDEYINVLINLILHEDPRMLMRFKLQNFNQNHKDKLQGEITYLIDNLPYHVASDVEEPPMNPYTLFTMLLTQSLLKLTELQITDCDTTFIEWVINNILHKFPNDLLAEDLAHMHKEADNIEGISPKDIEDRDAEMITEKISIPLKILNLQNNQLENTHITGLKNLTELTELRLTSNLLTDITPIQHLTNLTTLDLSFNKGLTDITPLEHLTSLQNLGLVIKELHDMSPLKKLNNLVELVVNSEANRAQAMNILELDESSKLKITVHIPDN